jgi:hypothetical protein
MTHSCDFSCNHDAAPPAAPTVTVDADALRQALEALTGPDHLIRELQATRGPLFDNPIDKLIRQYHEQVAS